MDEKTFRKHPKSSTFVCIKFSLQFVHNLCPFVEIARHLEIPLIDSCETSHNRRQAPEVFRANTVVTSLSRDIYSDRPKNNIIIKFSLCVIHVL